MSVCIVTASFGGADNIVAPIQQDIPDVHFHVFGQKCSGWTYHEYPFRDTLLPVYRARCIKVMPELFIEGQYDWYIWLDGSIQMDTPSFAKMLCELTDLWGVYRCTSVQTIAEQASYLATSTEEFKHIALKEQFEYYDSLEYPDKCLYETGVFVRRSTPLTRLICGEWMTQLFLWSYRDQAALPYVFWRNKLSPTILKGSSWRGEHHHYHGHNRDYLAKRYQRTEEHIRQCRLVAVRPQE